jgi:hypothetical protein
MDRAGRPFSNTGDINPPTAPRSMLAGRARGRVTGGRLPHPSSMAMVTPIVMQRGMFHFQVPFQDPSHILAPEYPDLAEFQFASVILPPTRLSQHFILSYSVTHVKSSVHLLSDVAYFSLLIDVLRSSLTYRTNSGSWILPNSLGSRSRLASVHTTFNPFAYSSTSISPSSTTTTKTKLASSFSTTSPVPSTNNDNNNNNNNNANLDLNNFNNTAVSRPTLPYSSNMAPQSSSLPKSTFPPARSQSRFAATMALHSTTSSAATAAAAANVRQTTNLAPHSMSLKPALHSRTEVHLQGQPSYVAADTNANSDKEHVHAHPTPFGPPLIPSSGVGLQTRKQTQNQQGTKTFQGRTKAQPRSWLENINSVVEKGNQRASGAPFLTSTSHPVPQPQPTKPGSDVPLYVLAPNLLPSSNLSTAPLPPGLSAALAAANKGRKLPSVLEPKRVLSEISYRDAIAYLLSVLSTNTPANVNGLSNNGGKEILPDCVVDVTFYDPNGTYLIPVRELVLRNTTSLPILVRELQSLLDQNIQDLNRIAQNNVTAGFVSPYLVSSVQVRIFNITAFESFPKVRGEMGRGGKKNHAAEYMQWACGDSEMELYWNTYRRVVQRGVGSDGLQMIGKPMFKVRTVLKLKNRFGLALVGGSHIFAGEQMPPEQPSLHKSKIPGVKGSMMKNQYELSEDDQALLATVIGVFSTKQSPEDVSKADIVAAVSNTYNAREAGKLENQKSAEDYEMMRRTFMFKEYEKQLAGYRQLNDLPQPEKPVDPKRNWGYYQRMGGNSEIHKAFDLSKSKAPFEEEDFPPPGYYDQFHANTKIPTASDMVPYQEINPAVYGQEEIKSDIPPPVLERMWKQNEAAIGFDEADDAVFFPSPTSGQNPSKATSTLAKSSPIDFGKRNPRIDVDGLLTSVNTRKNINRTMSPSPLQNVANMHAGTFDMGYGSFASFNNLANTMQPTGQGFYDSVYAIGDAHPSAYENLLHTNSDQTSNFYENLGEHGVGSSIYHPAMNIEANHGFHNNNFGNHFGTSFNNPLNTPGNQAIGSLSAYNEMLNSNNPTLGMLNSVGMGNEFGTNAPHAAGNQFTAAFNAAGTPTNSTGFNSYVNDVSKARGHRMTFPRPRTSSSQLRAESPAFKSVIKQSNADLRHAAGGSPTRHIGTGLARGFPRMQGPNGEDFESRG